jgi:CheY-like chemotaxis protein
MNGDLEVTSEAGLGSVFTFTAVLRSLDQRGFPALDPTAGCLEGKAVLLVDDNATSRRVLQSLLGRWGMTCIAVDTPFAALDLILADRRFDVAVIDMSTAEMNGQQLASSLREVASGTDLPLILLSSLVTRLAPEHRGLFAATLAKPVKTGPLRDALVGVVAPCDAPLPTTAPTGRRPDAGDAVPTPALHVLLAEDNVVNQKVATLMLVKLGHLVDVVCDGREAVEALRRGRYDVVLMDVNMPRMDGLEATAIIRSDLPSDRQPRIVALTASAMAEDRLACSRAGMDAYLTKPIRTHELSSALSAPAAGRAISVPTPS